MGEQQRETALPFKPVRLEAGARPIRADRARKRFLGGLAAAVAAVADPYSVVAGGPVAVDPVGFVVPVRDPNVVGLSIGVQAINGPPGRVDPILVIISLYPVLVGLIRVVASADRVVVDHTVFLYEAHVLVSVNRRVADVSMVVVTKG